MPKVAKIRREELMDWVERMLTEGNYNKDVRMFGASIRHVDDDKTTYLVVSDEETREIWFELGPGWVCDIKSKRYKEEKNNE